MHVVITGASSGIGEALAREYAAAGASLTLVARRRAVLDKLAAELRVPCHVVGADLGAPDPDDATHADAAALGGDAPPEVTVAWLVEAEARLGPIDILINNAGIQNVAPFGAVPLDADEALLRLNLITPLRLLRAVLPAMRARGSGTVINIASAAAFSTVRGMVYYNASKSALAAASETLRAELRKTGVHVLTVYPGPVHTPLAEAALDVYERATLATRAPTGTAPVLARKIRRAALARRARIIYPAVYRATWWFEGLSRWFTDRFAPEPRSPKV